MLQHKVNETLDNFVKGKGDLIQPSDDVPDHKTHLDIFKIYK